MDIDANEELDTERAGWTQIGRITSSARGHSVGKMLALANLDVSHTWPGARVMVATGGGRPVPASVANTPFFDPAGLRLRGTTQYTPKESAEAGGNPAPSPKGRKPRAER
jgi:glycine cleavage system aminomethyltransferase T